MGETFVTVGDVQLCAEEFGERAYPSILLISGAAASMDWWDAEFCERLAAGGRHVIRYDHRDTGRSTSYPPGKPGYSGRDLVADASALIDRLADGHAHVVGVSMGGGLAQDLVVRDPAQVASLTLIATSPIARRDPTPLPPMTERLRRAFADPPPDPDWTDREAVVEFFLAQEELFAGPAGFDPEQTRTSAERVFDRTVNLESSAKNHWLVVGADDDDAGPADLTRVSAPTLVIHGSVDPLFPVEHGKALAAEIPGARLLVLDGVGHQVPPRSTWDTVIPAILRHTGG